MKIRLLVNVPVGKEHNLIAGKILETIEPPKGKSGIWVLGDSSLPVKIWPREYEPEGDRDKQS